jgi:DNA-binding transcriptional LysR family regulator
MSKAAARLGVSQSAVSQTIRALEEDFGAPLINRGARPFTLTPAGLTLRNRGAILLDEVLNLRGTVVDASQGIMPDLKVGLVDSFAATCGTRLVQSLLGKVSQLSIRTGRTPDLSQALVRRELDIVVSTDLLEDMESIVCHQLMTERFLMIQPKQHAMQVRTFADLTRLAHSLPLVRFNQQSHLGSQIDRFLRQHHLQLPRKLEVDTADTLTSMVAGGIGWAMTTPLCLLQGARFSKQIKIVNIEGMSSARSLYLLARKGEYSQLVQETILSAKLILETSVLSELRATHPYLDQLIEIDK